MRQRVCIEQARFVFGKDEIKGILKIFLDANLTR
tara:strand:- start:569 stop:670 length:102 start_codon:yes stop_codon:yes gene_type:complete